MLCLAPEYLQQAKLFVDLDPQGQVILGVHMIRRCWKLDQKLHSLYQRLGKTLAGPAYWPELARGTAVEDDSGDGLLFPVAYYFPNLAVANTVLVYWSVQCILWHGLMELYGLMERLRAQLTPTGCFEAFVTNLLANSGIQDKEFVMPPLDSTREFSVPALNIMQSVEFCLQEEMMDHGPKAAAAPLRIAMETIRPHPEYQRELSWAEDAMTRVQSRSLRLLMYYTGNEG